MLQITLLVSVSKGEIYAENPYVFGKALRQTYGAVSIEFAASIFFMSNIETIH